MGDNMFYVYLSILIMYEKQCNVMQCYVLFCYVLVIDNM